MASERKASDELLAMRELLAGSDDPLVWASEYSALRYVPWVYVDRAIGNWVDSDGATANGWPHLWVTQLGRTHLEVVEMIERAAVAAMREEGVM